MQNLIESYSAAQQTAREAGKALTEAFAALDLKAKLVVVCENDCKVFDNALKYDQWYSAGGDISLYDELYWERYETKTLSEVFESVYDELGTELDATAEQVAASILADGGARAAVLLDMLKNNLGKARHDW